jgi:protoporphyrinogen oxidase
MKKAIILGAGPAGLAAGLELIKHNIAVELIEKNNQVGGLARTIQYKGNYFDLGPHRFFTKNDEIEKLWQDLLKDKFIKVSRLTRICYKNRFFYYPLKPFNALFNLGILDTAVAIFSFLKAKLTKYKTPETFEEFITHQFGKKLFTVFFKTYTEKVWGIPCSQIAAEWASQRIKGLNLTAALLNAVFGQREQRKVKSLIEEFHYPLYGAGMMYEAMQKVIESKGGVINLNADVLEMHWQGNTITKVVFQRDGKILDCVGGYYISSIPITELVYKLKPSLPAEIINTAEKLYYRDHITVNLIVPEANIFPDNWIYVHSPQVKVARIANYRNFSKAMVGNQNTSAISLEYFCFATDEIWSKTDDELLKLAIEELKALKLLKSDSPIDGFVVRERNAYPMYYTGYQNYLDILKDYLSKFTNLQIIGRSGLYKYNNQDHSISTGLYAARNCLGENYNLWQVNIDAEYLETKSSE